MARQNKNNSFALGGSAAREQRMRASVSDSEIISTKSYNLTMGLVVAYGLLINIIICRFIGNTFALISPIPFLIITLLLTIAGCFISRISHNPLVSFLGYNMVVIPMGLMVSVLVYAYGGISSMYVIMAFTYTLAITAVMILAAIVFPNFFSKIGGVLFAGLIGILICGIIGMFFQGGSYLVSLFAAGIFALYIGYDFWRSQQFPKTLDNAVDCALDIYVDIINLFIRLLEIFGKLNDR